MRAVPVPTTRPAALTAAPHTQSASVAHAARQPATTRTRRAHRRRHTGPLTDPSSNLPLCSLTQCVPSQLGRLPAQDPVARPARAASAPQSSAEPIRGGGRGGGQELGRKGRLPEADVDGGKGRVSWASRRRGVYDEWEYHVFLQPQGGEILCFEWPHSFLLYARIDVGRGCRPPDSHCVLTSALDLRPRSSRCNPSASTRRRLRRRRSERDRRQVSRASGRHSLSSQHSQASQGRSTRSLRTRASGGTGRRSWSRHCTFSRCVGGSSSWCRERRAAAGRRADQTTCAHAVSQCPNPPRRPGDPLRRRGAPEQRGAARVVPSERPGHRRREDGAVQIQGPSRCAPVRPTGLLTLRAAAAGLQPVVEGRPPHARPSVRHPRRTHH